LQGQVIITPVGRIKQYNEEQVLRKAMAVFWANGYHNTSIRTLEKEMGINQFSIYASFKNKRNLFRMALQFYGLEIEKQFLGHLGSKDSSLEDIRIFLNRFSQAIIRHTIPDGCLMVKTASECAHDKQIMEMVDSFFFRIKSLFIRALDNSQQKGKVKSTFSVEDGAEYLVGISQSLSVYAKMKTQNEVNAYINFSLNALA